jgi:hypothetical protein
MKATAPMCSAALSTFAPPGLWACRLCAITRKKMRSTILSTAQAGEHMVAQVRARLHHTPCVTRGPPAFAGEGHEVVVATVITASAGKAMREDAAFQVFTKGLADIRLWSVVVALPVELTCAGKFIPSLEMFGNGLVEKGALGLPQFVAKPLE